MPDGASRPHRPSLYDDLTTVIDNRSAHEPITRAELAATTAAVVVTAGRTGADGERFVALADRVGLDTLAALWRDADPVSLAGALWALYLLRQWCQENPEEVARMWRAGEAFAAADAVVAGMPDYADVEAARGLADAVLAGAYGGDFGVALERAAAVFRVLATGRRELARSGSLGPREIELAARNERVAVNLITAAGLWRVGALH